MVREIKKIYIDSRLRNSSSKSSTDFAVQLNESVLLPDDTAVIVTDICIPHTWYTIEYYNEKIYFRVWDPLGRTTDYIATLQHRSYDISSLASAVATAMSQAFGTSNAFAGDADVTTGRIVITMPTVGNYFFTIYNDITLKEKARGTWTGPAYNPYNPQSCNGVLGHDDDQIEDPSQRATQWVSGFVDVLGVHNVYITSPQFGNNSMGPNGERNILKKVVTTAGFGELITDTFVNAQDVNSCAKKLFQTMQFKLTDVRGNALVLNGGHCSLTLIFVSG